MKIKLALVLEVKIDYVTFLAVPSVSYKQYINIFRVQGLKFNKVQSQQKNPFWISDSNVKMTNNNNNKYYSPLNCNTSIPNQGKILWCIKVSFTILHNLLFNYNLYVELILNSLVNSIILICH